MKLCIESRELLDDIRAAAFLESELHPELDRHRRHEMADICETDNIERVWRVLALADAQVRLTLSRILHQQDAIPLANELRRPATWHFRFRIAISTIELGFLREKIHDYMVASAMADRTAVIIPEASSVWRERHEAALLALQNLAATARNSSRPVRRPLWPL